MKNIYQNWYTLIELLVAITIIVFIFLWFRSVNFNSITDKQKLEIYTNKFVSNFEEVRNNSLIWRWWWVSSDVNNPDIATEWKIEFSLANSWSFKTYYSTWTSYVEFSDYSLAPQDNFWIKSMQCLDLNWGINATLTWTSMWIISFKWSSLSLTWWCNQISSKQLRLELFFRWNTKALNINTVSWLVEEQ